MDLARLIDERMKKWLRQNDSSSELGTITEAGLQLDGFPYPIPTWFQRDGVTFPPGTRVKVEPLKTPGEYWVDGPAVQKGVSG